MTKERHALQLLNQAYGEYIAARFLLQNEFFIQGATMASCSVEKYLKAILVSQGHTKKDIRVHLNNIDPLKEKLKECYVDITEKFDPHFFDILSTVYTMRYHDDILNEITLNFFLNQFLGELDYFVYFVQSLVNKIEIDGQIIPSHYRRDALAKEEKLWKNNFILEGISKKEFMERPDIGFGYHIEPKSNHKEIEILGRAIKMPYTGTMRKIEIAKINSKNQEG